MGLNWQLTNIENWEKVCRTEDGKLRGGTECLIYASLFVGLPVLDDPVAFWTRLQAWERLVGAISSSGEPLSLDIVKAHKGLQTNASKDTDAQFWKRLRQAHERRCREAALRLQQPVVA